MVRSLKNGADNLSNSRRLREATHSVGKAISNMGSGAKVVAIKGWEFTKKIGKKINAMKANLEDEDMDHVHMDDVRTRYQQKAPDRMRTTRVTRMGST